MLSQIKPHIPILVCPPVNSFKFPSCDYTPPGTRSLNGFPGTPTVEIRRGIRNIPTPVRSAGGELVSFTVGTTTVSDRLDTPNFRS